VLVAGLERRVCGAFDEVFVAGAGDAVGARRGGRKGYAVGEWMAEGGEVVHEDACDAKLVTCTRGREEGCIPLNVCPF